MLVKKEQAERTACEKVPMWESAYCAVGTAHCIAWPACVVLQFCVAEGGKTQ